MKQLTTTFLLFLFCLCQMVAVPAHKGTIQLTQPDGTTVTIRLHGDEYLHFNTTDDGYSVVKNEQGFYVYARLGADGQLEPTGMVAHDTHLRNHDEQTFLSGVKKYITPRMSAERQQERQAELARQGKAREQRRAAQYDYNNFRGLVILIEFNDRQFSRSDYKDLIDEMINKEGYTGYTENNGSWQPCTGSVRDYFEDNSFGKFKPEFDVYGPYQVNMSQYSGNDTRRVLNAAINAADADINFRDYDRDNDNKVDMIYFILAGFGAEYQGNDSRLWWPHRSVLVANSGWNLYKDNVMLWDYASSVEMQGFTMYPSTHALDGIGTICHEFSHVLGLPDFYDANYEDDGMPESNHPYEWSVMSGGNYLNNSRTPAGYSMLERTLVGFSAPVTISEEGSFELEAIANTGSGYRINTPVNREYFLFENRQKTTKWDAHLPGHGMLVFRVDSTNASVWANNQVNNNPNHNYYQLVRAGGGRGATGSDPFPGNRNVRTLTNTTTPANLLTWAGRECVFGLQNIYERNGLISFDVVNLMELSSIELPESANIGVGLSRQFTPVITPSEAPCNIVWTSTDEQVATVSTEGVVTGVAVGETDIVAVPNGDESKKAVCHITVVESMDIENIALYKALSDGDEASLLLTNAQVLQVHQNNVYVRDSTGSIVISEVKGASFKKGDVLNGKVYGSYTLTNKVPYLKGTADSDFSSVKVTSGTAEPRMTQLDSLTQNDYADYIVLEKVRLEAVSQGVLTGVFGVSESRRIRIFNTFGLSGFSMPRNYDGKTFNIPGILVTRVAGGEVYDELALMGAPQERVKQEFTLSYQVGEGGQLLYDGELISGNGSLTLLEGDNAMLMVMPHEGYVIDQLLFDDEITNENTITINDVDADHSVVVTFKEEEQLGITAASRATDDSSVVYTTAGRRVSAAAGPGLYIVRQDGRYRKVAIGR